MSNLAHIRIAGYATILSLHMSNIYYMEWYRRQVYTEDERILIFKHLGNRFLTVWTFMLQIAYAVFSIICEITVLKNCRQKSYKLPFYMGEIRDVVFSSILWPISWGVATVFWGFFIYDRSLIFPKHLDLVVPSICNHVIHTAIVPIVLFDVVTRPRVGKSNHLLNIGVLTVYIATYLAVMLYTYKERNVWLYPIFGQLYGSVYFIALCAFVYKLLLFYYFIQWPISNVIHGDSGKKNKRRRKKKNQ